MTCLTDNLTGTKEKRKMPLLHSDPLNISEHDLQHRSRWEWVG